MTSLTEAAMIRARLRLRYNDVSKCHEVFTTIHGTGIFRWYKISYENYLWYLRNFPEIKVDIDVAIMEDGSIKEQTPDFLVY